MSEAMYNRLDSENRLGLDLHAARALTRKGQDGKPEFESLDPVAMRAAIKRASFRNKEAHLREAEKMREVMLRMLNRLEGRRTPEQTEFLKLLGRQIESALKVWQSKPDIDMKDAPTKDGIQHWLDGLPEQTLDGMLEYREPRLVVVPPILTTQLLKMIEGHTHWPKGWNDVRAPGWKFGVTDSVENLDFDPTIFYVNHYAPKRERIKRTNEQMVLEYERRFQGIEDQDTMPQYAYVPTAATVMAEGKALDRRNYTVFKRRPEISDGLPQAHFNFNYLGYEEVKVGLYGTSSGDSYKELRCRPWVEGGDERLEMRCFSAVP